jgi:hypothetical protein
VTRAARLSTTQPCFCLRAICLSPITSKRQCAATAPDPGAHKWALARGDLLQILLVSLLTGFAVSRLGTVGAPITAAIDLAAEAFFGIIHIIVLVAPIGAFGRWLSAGATYLYQDGTRYWYATQATLCGAGPRTRIEVLPEVPTVAESG